MAKIDYLLQYIVEHGGSDLHLSEGQPPKIRLNGELHEMRDDPLTDDELVPMMQEISAERGWEKYTSTGDLDFAYELDEDSRFRCNYYKQVHGHGAIFRLIPNKIATLEDLGLPSVIQKFGDERGGLVLVTGPTGSGKSTTLAALVDYINETSHRHIVTIEEPIEFVHKHKNCLITQREVPIDASSFSQGLKATLRQDADIVLVGEMRDLETISLALTAAETGLLIFGTLHTNNARKTVDRLIDAFPSDKQAQVRTMLAASLRGIVAQLLLKRQDTGGRIAVNEILVGNNAVSAIIREGSTQKLLDVIVGGKKDGMQFMDDGIWSLLQKGIVSPHEAYMKAIDKNRFKAFLPAEEKILGHSAGGGEE
jgi:twitching motility protein PilT